MTPFTFVIGPPSGGTSTVSGILHKLGINMGDIFKTNGPDDPFTKKRTRHWYDYYECKGLTAVLKHKPPEQRPRMMKVYLEQRMMGNGPQGAKHPWITPILNNAEDIENWPIRLVHVKRPIHDVVRSNIKVNHTKLMLNRLGELLIAECELLDRIPPILTVEYDNLTSKNSAHRATQVHEIKRALDLDSSPAQVLDAIRFIDPALNHHRGS